MTVRSYYVFIVAFWCASISITVFQQSNLLSDLKELWKRRVETEQKIETDLQKLSTALDERRNSLLASNQQQLQVNSNSIEDLLAKLEIIEKKSKESVDNLALDLDVNQKKFEDEEHRRAVERDELERETIKKKDRSNRGNKAGIITAMRTECKNYGAADALKHLVQNVRSKIYEPNAGDMLRQMADGHGGSTIELIKVDPQYSNLNERIEEVLDHLEESFPKVWELWPKWFKENGDPVPAPKFLSESEGGEVHSSEKYGKPAFEAMMTKS